MSVKYNGQITEEFKEVALPRCHGLRLLCQALRRCRCHEHLFVFVPVVS